MMEQSSALRRTSEILRNLVPDEATERVSLAEILSRLRGRAFGVLLIVFAAPNLIPMPPGLSTISGALIALVAAQLLVGRRALWVPERIAHRSFAASDLKRIVEVVAPRLAKIERWTRPRAVGMVRLRARQFLGVLILVLALIMALPIPIVGNGPPALAVVLIGFGLVERDGLVVAAGTVVGLIDIGVIIGLAIGFSELIKAYLPTGWWPF